MKETNLNGSCLGALYLVNSKTIHQICQLKSAEAREDFFPDCHTWAIYSIGTIATNQSCPAI
jgi:hypothetical protein